MGKQAGPSPCTAVTEKWQQSHCHGEQVPSTSTAHPVRGRAQPHGDRRKGRWWMVADAVLRAGDLWAGEVISAKTRMSCPQVLVWHYSHSHICATTVWGVPFHGRIDKRCDMWISVIGCFQTCDSSKHEHGARNTYNTHMQIKESTHLRLRLRGKVAAYDV